MVRSSALILVLALAACNAIRAPGSNSAGNIDVPTLAQGWTADDRGTFYTTGQGSLLMPSKWFFALRRPGSSDHFAGDQLARYGYLPSADKSALPVGFVVDGDSGDVGMTCAACHTGQLSYKGQTWRIDGGRASADFQAFLTDLTAAARATAASPDALDSFAVEAAGAGATADDIAAAKRGFADWTTGFGGFMDRSMPTSAWGPGRLDAFGMIFNRVTGLDLAIDGNLRPADAPVRYPFLWDAAFQDRTQWDGAAPNGSYVKAMARNTGEVFGVFGHFNPQVIAPRLVLYANSVNFRNLQTLEQEIAKLKPPPWPASVFGLNNALLTQGAAVFDQNCAACHAQRPSSAVPGAWATPVCRVGTDPAMYRNALLSAQSGRLAGTLQLASGGFLHDPDQKVSILANAVVGSLILDAGAVDTGIWRAINADAAAGLKPGGFGAGTGPARGDLPAECRDAPTAAASAAAASATSGAAGSTGAPAKIAAAVTDLYKLPASGTAKASAPGAAAYEARVLTGIWAVAPYLHNGSVPSLAELLKPAAARARVLPVATPEFDPVNVGVAAAPAGTVPTSIDTPGNSNSGHEYGTTLSPPDQAALLEYLKTL